MGAGVPERPTEPDAPLSKRAIVLGGVLLAMVGVGAFLAVLFFYGGGTEQDRAGLDAVRTAGTLVVGTGGLFALLLAARRQRSTEQTLEQQRLTLENQRATLEHQREVAAAAAQDAAEQRSTDLYTRAVDQLGSGQAPVRLGGLHALERLAQNTPSQRQTIVDVICAYLRMPYIGDESSSEDVSSDSRIKYEQQHPELQVRLTAQRILSAHLKSDAGDTFWPNVDLDFTEAHLHALDLAHCLIRNAKFSGAKFYGNAGFTRTEFSGSAEFANAQFFGSAKFNYANFSEHAIFDQVKFSDIVWFSGARFSKCGGKFEGVQFAAETWFDQAKFFGMANFDTAKFSKSAHFNLTRFANYAVFGAQFSGSVSFLAAKFCGGAAFNGARFAGNAIFEKAIFEKAELFGDADFDRAATFTEAQFFGDARFPRAQFSGIVTFDDVQFSGDPIFDGARTRAAEDAHSWPTTWFTREARDGEEKDWLYLVRARHSDDE